MKRFIISACFLFPVISTMASSQSVSPSKEDSIEPPCPLIYQESNLGVSVLTTLGDGMPSFSVALKSRAIGEAISLIDQDTMIAVGTRRMENGRLLLGYTRGVSYYSGSGDFSLELEVGGETVEVRNFSVSADHCGWLSSQNHLFTVEAPKPLPLDPTLEYLPLDGGDLLLLDPKNGEARNINGTKVWADVEVNRSFMEIKQGTGGSASAGLKWERNPPKGKVLIGGFVEFGVDRGPFPKSEGTLTLQGGRRVYGRLIP